MPPASATGPAVRLGEAAQGALRTVRVNLMWIGLTLLGLVVAGIAPATVAAAEAHRAGRHGATVAVESLMWESFRRQLGPANLRMLPLLVVQAGAAAMVWIVMGGGVPGTASAVVLTGLAVISLAWSTIALAVIVAVPRVREQELLVTWRLAVLLPATVPGRFLGLILGLGAWTVLAAFLWPLALLAGASVPIQLALALLGRRIELLLEDISAESRGARAAAARTGDGPGRGA